MTKAGWAFMTIAWTAIIAALAFCYYHVLRKNDLGSKDRAES